MLKKLRPGKYCGIIGRIESLNLVLSLDKWTSKSEGLDSGREYTLYLANDIFDIVKISNIKSNITIKSIDELVIN